MIKSSEHEKLGRFSNYESPNFIDCSEVRSADPTILFYYQILIRGRPEIFYKCTELAHNLKFGSF